MRRLCNMDVVYELKNSTLQNECILIWIVWEIQPKNTKITNAIKTKRLEARNVKQVKIMPSFLLLAFELLASLDVSCNKHRKYIHKPSELLKNGRKELNKVTPVCLAWITSCTIYCVDILSSLKTYCVTFLTVTPFKTHQHLFASVFCETEVQQFLKLQLPPLLC